jgi:hypothetical protein
MQGNLAKVVFLAMALIAVPLAALLMTDTTFVLAQSRPARTTKRLMTDVAAAKMVFKNEGGQSDLEQYLQRLKSIDCSETPSPVQRAFSNYVATVQTSVEAGRKSGDTNVVYGEWMRAESALDEVIKRYSKRRK